MRGSRTSRRRSWWSATPDPIALRRCWSSAPTPGRRTTSGAGAACTAGPPRCRSGGRSSAATSRAHVDADGYDGRVATSGDHDPHARAAAAVPGHPLVSAVVGVERMVQLGAAARRVGGARGDRARLRRRRRPRRRPRRSGRPAAAAHRRSQRVLVVGDARRASSASWTPAATGRSCRATPASGRSATRRITTR